MHGVAVGGHDHLVGLFVGRVWWMCEDLAGANKRTGEERRGRTSQHHVTCPPTYLRILHVPRGEEPHPDEAARVLRDHRGGLGVGALAGLEGPVWRGLRLIIWGCVEKGKKWWAAAYEISTGREGGGGGARNSYNTTTDDAPFLVPVDLRHGLQPGQGHEDVAFDVAGVEEREPLGDVRQEGDAVEELDGGGWEGWGGSICFLGHLDSIGFETRKPETHQVTINIPWQRRAACPSTPPDTRPGPWARSACRRPRRPESGSRPPLF